MGVPHSPPTSKASMGLSKGLATCKSHEVASCYLHSHPSMLRDCCSWRFWGFLSQEPLKYFRGSCIPYAHPTGLVDQTSTVSYINIFQTIIDAAAMNKIHRLYIHPKWVLSS